MEVKEKKASQVLSKERGLSLAKKGVEVTKTSLTKVSKEVNALNIHEEQEETGEENRSSSVSPMSFLNKKEQRKWEKLTPNRKKRFVKHTQLNAKSGMGRTYNAGEWKSNSKNQQSENGRSSYKGNEASLSSTSLPNEKKGTQIVTGRNPMYGTEAQQLQASGRGIAAKGAGTAANTALNTTAGTTAGTATGAATGAATGGVTVAVGAAKKTADKFRESLEQMSIQRAESIQEIHTKGKALMDENKDIHGLQSVGKYVLGATAVITTPIMLALNSTVFAVLGALLAVVLPIILLVVIISVVIVIVSFIISTTRDQNGGEAIVRIAKAEYANAAMNVGGTKYKEWYQMNADWCGMFVSWCADEAGVLDTAVPRTASVNNAVQWFQERDEYKSRESGYQPRGGDIIFFTNLGMSHMGIVVDYDEETDRVETIEGNSGASNTNPYHAGSHVTNNFYQRTTAVIGGYGTPSYPILNLTGDTNAERIYNAFLDAGYSKAASAAIVGNLFQEAGTDSTGDINIHATEGNGEGVGMVQWSFGRKTAFLQYCEDMGQPWPDTGLEIQISYLMKELESTQWLWSSISREYGNDCNITLDEFKHADDIDFATKAFCAKFERCHLADANLSYRQNMAHTVYDSFE